MLDQRPSKVHDPTRIIGHAPVMAVNDIRMFPSGDPGGNRFGEDRARPRDRNRTP
ncbi:MAG: hypothetical protein OXC82_05160 [Rhodobacteraceae bacterium]|nr:hypothetical protein [Paracoccaceae bacterium]MCY4249811.1 hypothetical protein [Paracoccaceae bacterium]